MIPALVAVLLAEVGGRNQAIAHRAVLAGRAPIQTLLALIAVSIAGLGLSAWGGSMIARLLIPDARLLLAALALIFAGAPMLVRMRTGVASEPDQPLLAFAAAQLGDSAQFIVFALAALGNQPVLATVGGVIGVVVATMPPLLLGGDWPGGLPVRALRLIAAALLIMAGLIIAVRALRLV